MALKEEDHSVKHYFNKAKELNPITYGKRIDQLQSIEAVIKTQEE